MSEPDGRVGQRIHRYRTDAGLSLGQLAVRAGVSKGYLSTLESGERGARVSGETLYALAEALGVYMSDLLGREVIRRETDSQRDELPEGLAAFAAEARLPAMDVEMLRRIEFRGSCPNSVDRWRHIYNAIKLSESLDD